MGNMCGKEYDISCRLISERPERGGRGGDGEQSPSERERASAKAQKQGSVPGGAWKAGVGGAGEGASLGLSAGVRLRGSVEKLGLRFGGRMEGMGQL